jgi:hypothetical protein
MVETKLIPLEFSRRAFEDVYKPNEYGSMYRNKEARGHLMFFSLASVALLISVIISVVGNRLVVLTAMLALLWIGYLIWIVVVYLRLEKWKKSINTWIDSIGVYTKSSLTITGKGFLLTQDEKETYESWENITSCKSETNYIRITAKEEYMFPRDTMSARDFEYFRSFITSYLKNGL